MYKVWANITHGVCIEVEAKTEAEAMDVAIKILEKDFPDKHVRVFAVLEQGKLDG